MLILLTPFDPQFSMIWHGPGGPYKISTWEGCLDYMTLILQWLMCLVQLFQPWINKFNPPTKITNVVARKDCICTHLTFSTWNPLDKGLCSSYLIYMGPTRSNHLGREVQPSTYLIFRAYPYLTHWSNSSAHLCETHHCYLELLDEEHI